MANRPELLEHLFPAWDAFWELGTDRPQGFGLSPIPHRSILEYAKYEEMSGDRYQKFRILIRAADSEYLTFHRERSEREERRKNG